jgi:transketolase
VKEVMNIEPLADKWRAFGWNVVAVDGHNFNELLPALKDARKADHKSGKPTLIIANTIKGKGVSFMEHQIGWHGVCPKADEAQKAITEIKGKLI